MQEKTVTISIDEISFKLKKQHDFQWLKDLGKVFAVFDEQDSGNICFGVDSGGRRLICKVCRSADNGI
jgi:serine/threonine-protein kinase